MDNVEGVNVQSKKKRKVGETSTNDDVNDVDPGKEKSNRNRSWVWDHFTKDETGGRANCNWCKKSYVVDSH